MKKTLTFWLALCVFFNITYGQLSCPQLSFYSKPEAYKVGSDNDVEESDLLLYTITDERQALYNLFRIYEISRTSEIFYATADNSSLPFRCEDNQEKGLFKVDFGPELLRNSIVKQDINGYIIRRLRFRSPVKKIDPRLFSEQLQKVKLPMIHHLTYISSTEITTTNLVSIEGYDVIDYTALISKDSTLIVAATCGKDIYHIPNLVKRIGTSALRGSKLKSLVIPASVTDIGDLAFDHTEITSYYFLSTDIPNLSLHAFGNHMDEKVTIYVPRKSLKAYRRCWKPLKKHIKALPRSIDIIATEQFDMTYDYKLKYGLQITENGQIVNKNNKFLPDDFTVALDV